MTLRVGIIGCGGIAALHAKGYRAAEGAKVVACADLNGERARAFAGQHEIPEVYTDYEAMLDGERLDAVSICTPNYAHCQPTLAALAAGVAVLCEKPIAMNSEEAQRMVDGAAASKAPLSIGHHLRYLPAARFLKTMIQEDELGRIYFGRSHALRRRGVPGWGEFHIKNKSGGGPLIDIGVHALDLIIWLMGSPEPLSVSGSVYTEFGDRAAYHNPHGTYARSDFDVEDFACGMIKFRSGSTLMLETSWAAHLPDEENAAQTILGDRSGARIVPFGSADAPPLQIFTSRGEALMDTTPRPFPSVEPHIEQLKHWVGVVRGEREVLVRPEECLNVQRIIDAIYLSSESGREIVLPRIHDQFGEGDGVAAAGQAMAATPA